MISKSGASGIECATYPAQQLETRPFRIRIGTNDSDDARRELMPASPWTCVKVPNGLSKGPWYNFQSTNGDHVELEFELPSPPQSDHRELSSNYPNTSSSEDSPSMNRQAEPYHSNALRKPQQETVRKQHTVTFHNARQLKSRAIHHGNTTEGRAIHHGNTTERDLICAESSEDENPSEPAVFNQQLKLPSRHRPNGKVQPDICSWSMAQVQSWLRHECRKHNVLCSHAEKFHMNGKGLLLIGLRGFQQRIPQSGHLLYRDLQRLLRMRHNRKYHWQEPAQAGAVESRAQATALAV